jgi:Rrf2 family protein
MFSKACEYGIRALIFIAMKSNGGERVNTSDIVKEIDSPTAFMAKILQKLVKVDIVQSVKGPHGGFQMSQKNISEIKLADIVKVIDGDAIYNGCGLGLNECNELKPCPLHGKYKRIREDLKTMLETTYLKDLASQLEDGIAFLKV